MKKILVITGSPRKNGNSNLMADAFIEGAVSQQHTVTLFDAASKKVAPCRACDQCWSKSRACIFDDDFTELAELVVAADVIVFASPLYWFTFSAQIKAAIDRLYAFDSARMPFSLPAKECVLLTCAADDHVFAGILSTYELSIAYLGWTNKGILAVPNVFAKGDILKTDALEQARQLGVQC